LYSCWVSEEEHQRIQRVAVELATKGKILDERNRPIELRTDPNGKQTVGRYALTKHLLLKFATHEVSSNLITSAEKRRRTVL